MHLHAPTSSCAGRFILHHCWGLVRAQRDSTTEEGKPILFLLHSRCLLSASPLLTCRCKNFWWLCKKILAPVSSVGCAGCASTGWAPAQSSLNPESHPTSTRCAALSPVQFGEPVSWVQWDLQLPQAPSRSLQAPSRAAPRCGCVHARGLRSFSCRLSRSVRRIPCADRRSRGNEKSASAKVRHTFSNSSQSWTTFPRCCCFPSSTLLRQFRKYKAIFTLFTAFSPA